MTWESPWGNILMWENCGNYFAVASYSSEGYSFEPRLYQRVWCSTSWEEYKGGGHLKVSPGTSLVAQWLRIRLPMQGTRVRALVREDPTCRGATKPVRHNYWAHVPQLLSPCAIATEAWAPRARAPQQEKPLRWEACAPQQRVTPALCN